MKTCIKLLILVLLVTSRVYANQDEEKDDDEDNVQNQNEDHGKTQKEDHGQSNLPEQKLNEDQIEEQSEDQAFNNYEGLEEQIIEPSIEELEEFEIVATRAQINEDQKLLEDRNNDLNYLRSSFAEVFAILGQECDFQVYNEIMPEFWRELFHGTYSQEENEHFDHVYWDVYIPFEESEPDDKSVKGRCNKENPSDTNCTVNKLEQKQREQNVCFTGGLIECVESTGTCGCLNTIATVSERVEAETGKPSPTGFACFVKVGEICRAPRYGIHPLVFPCVNHGVCNDFTSKCENTDEIAQ